MPSPVDLSPKDLRLIRSRYADLRPADLNPTRLYSTDRLYPADLRSFVPVSEPLARRQSTSSQPIQRKNGAAECPDPRLFANFFSSRYPCVLASSYKDRLFVSSDRPRPDRLSSVCGASAPAVQAKLTAKQAATGFIEHPFRGRSQITRFCRRARGRVSLLIRENPSFGLRPAPFYPSSRPLHHPQGVTTPHLDLTEDRPFDPGFASVRPVLQQPVPERSDRAVPMTRTPGAQQQEVSL